MKRYFTGLFFVLLVLVASAQPEQQKGFVGLSAGTSLPAGSFVSTTPGDDKAGYANPGFNAFAGAHLHIKDYIGFAGMMGYHNNPYNQKAFTGNYLASHSGFEYDFSAGSYIMINLLGGAFVSIPQGILDINLKGYFGVSVCTLPGTSSTSFSGVQGDPRFLLETGQNRSTAFSWGGGVNLLFYTHTSLAFIVDATYLQAEPEFNAVEIRVYENGELTVLSGLDLRQKFQIFNISAGIALVF